MPQGYNNTFTVKDKLLIAQRASQIVDLGNMYLGDIVADAQKFVREKNIMPSDVMDGDAVVHVAGGQADKFARVYYDGHMELVTRDTYVDENIYNLLPDRFKTYRPNG